MTIRRGRPPARRRTPRPAPGTTTVLAAYLVAAFLVLAAVFALRPHQGPPPPAPAWDYQRETVALDGGGGLNAYARWAVRATAWLTRGSIERQRDVQRLSPLDFLAGEAAARSLAGWRERHRLPLQGATVAAACALAAWGTLRRRPGRVWLVALLMLVGLTLLVTRPQSATSLAARAGTAIPNLVLRAGVTADPSGSVAAGPSRADRGGSVATAPSGPATTAPTGSVGPGGAATDPGAGRPGGTKRAATDPGGGRPGGLGAGDPAAEAVQRIVAARYWTAFVAEPLSRLQTGTTVLATAPPEGKPGLLGLLRARVAAVGDWAVGRRGPERAVIATLALAYVLPFAVLLVALAMLASCAQTLVWLLAVAGPLVAPLAADPRRRRAVLRWWLVPLTAAFALLAGAALAALVVIRVAELTHAADAYLGMLLAGSTVPLLAAALAVRRLFGRRPTRPNPATRDRSPGQPTRPRLELVARLLGRRPTPSRRPAPRDRSPRQPRRRPEPVTVRGGAA